MISEQMGQWVMEGSEESQGSGGQVQCFLGVVVSLSESGRRRGGSLDSSCPITISQDARGNDIIDTLHQPSNGLLVGNVDIASTNF